MSLKVLASFSCHLTSLIWKMHCVGYPLYPALCSGTLIHVDCINGLPAPPASAQVWLKGISRKYDGQDSEVVFIPWLPDLGCYRMALSIDLRSYFCKRALFTYCLLLFSALQQPLLPCDHPGIEVVMPLLSLAWGLLCGFPISHLRFQKQALY